MSPTSQAYWTDERVYETVTSAYVHAQLRPEEQALLQRPLYFGAGLTDDTYLDWILTRARRFFLILVQTGVPDQIFGVVDDSYDDDDLPIAEHAVPNLRLSYEPDRSLDKRFYKTQFRLLSRIVDEGEHIRYADEENVPVTALSLKAAVISFSQEGTDKVRLPTKSSTVFLRRRIHIEPKVTEAAILNEIATSRRLHHEHIISVFASYTHQGNFYVLSLPAPDWNLKGFLSDPPKSFTGLSKAERRRILVNWPHCLANALSWLHSNGQYHGAIRPSNIHISDSFQICLGYLEGDGYLCDRVRSDDIEAYQYGPPERWKRAITVRSTGAAAVSLPSGGRTARRIGGKDTGTSSSGRTSARSRTDSIRPAYSFQPASRGDYAKLRLSATMRTGGLLQPTSRGRPLQTPSDSHSIATLETTRPATSVSTPRRAPSILSSKSSNSNNLSSIFSGQNMFVANPEARSAVVQTWQSMEDDMFASDVFSLGAVILDIVTVLCKRSYNAFSRHRSSKNRVAGRGGGLADASFHANLGQVFTWAHSLQNEAEKKAKKDDSLSFHAVGPIVQLTLQCLARDPPARTSSDELERKLTEHICRSANMTHLHCKSELINEKVERRGSAQRSPERSASVTRSESRSTERLRQASTNLRALTAERQQPQQPEQRRLPPAQDIVRATQILQPPFLHIPRSAPTTPATTSASSLASFNFDALSDTVVADSPHSREQSVRRQSSRRNDMRLQQHGGWPNEQDGPEHPSYTWQRKDSQVDPHLTFDESVDTGAFTYMNYSTSASSEEGVKYFPPRSQTGPPIKAPPDRALPPVPPIPPESIPSSKPSRRPKAGRDEGEKRRPPSGTTRGRYPLRQDSLPMTMDEVDEYHELLRLTRALGIKRVSARSRSRQQTEPTDAW
ncbi:hypothetical protein PV08_11397 [Exophiala spinifera]|uniref:Protein kinase domain-containing protein n=1 Tax=Exophiala spinifera TaxID=91928 RepID=A0A0D2AUM4_9EURO|nr:uncharacterized protein PV08_11397 [Exophiala spinifera]KIW10433.1 hypothetical protein PV08_11397 [Exophiala spinifera]